MANNLISCDNVSNFIYVHDGATSSITDSFASPGGQPNGLAFDVATGNLISQDGANPDKIYVHDGISSSTTDNFLSPTVSSTGLGGAANGNLLSCENGASDLIHVHDGITSSVTDSFSNPGAGDYPACLAFDGTNLISSSISDSFPAPDYIYVHVGITSSTSDFFLAPPGAAGTFPEGLTYDPSTGNLISADSGSTTIFVHDGISGSTIDSFSSPSSQPTGLTWEVEGVSFIPRGMIF
jgi:DNA-binding beta-propeller fold protein YncE